MGLEAVMRRDHRKIMIGRVVNDNMIERCEELFTDQPELFFEGDKANYLIKRLAILKSKYENTATTTMLRYMREKTDTMPSLLDELVDSLLEEKRKKGKLRMSNQNFGKFVGIQSIKDIIQSIEDIFQTQHLLEFKTNNLRNEYLANQLSDKHFSISQHTIRGYLAKNTEDMVAQSMVLKRLRYFRGKIRDEDIKHFPEEYFNELDKDLIGETVDGEKYRALIQDIKRIIRTNYKKIFTAADLYKFLSKKTSAKQSYIKDRNTDYAETVRSSLYKKLLYIKKQLLKKNIELPKESFFDIITTRSMWQKLNNIRKNLPVKKNDPLFDYFSERINDELKIKISSSTLKHISELTDKNKSLLHDQFLKLEEKLNNRDLADLEHILKLSERVDTNITSLLVKNYLETKYPNTKRVFAKDVSRLIYEGMETDLKMETLHGEAYFRKALDVERGYFEGLISLLNKKIIKQKLTNVNSVLRLYMPMLIDSTRLLIKYACEDLAQRGRFKQVANKTLQTANKIGNFRVYNQSENHEKNDFIYHRLFDDHGIVRESGNKSITVDFLRIGRKKLVQNNNNENNNS